MTKDQKVVVVAEVVTNARRFFTQEEFVGMVTDIWAGLKTAEAKAIEKVEEVKP